MDPTQVRKAFCSGGGTWGWLRTALAVGATHVPATRVSLSGSRVAGEDRRFPELARLFYEAAPAPASPAPPPCCRR